MKWIDLEQGSDAWLAWRRSIITASDASIIMGTNPYCDEDELRKRKLGIFPEIKETHAIREGRRLEPIARDKFNSDYPGYDMRPLVVESSEHTFLGASLDGYGNKYYLEEPGGCLMRTDCILEIKCGKKSFKQAENKEIPKYYLSQIQHQLLVTGAEICYYYAFDGERAIKLQVLPDPLFKEEYLPLAVAFWMSLIFYKPVTYEVDV